MYVDIVYHVCVCIEMAVNVEKELPQIEISKVYIIWL